MILHYMKKTFLILLANKIKNMFLHKKQKFVLFLI